MTFKRFVGAFTIRFKNESTSVTLYETPRGYRMTMNGVGITLSDGLTEVEAKEWFYLLYDLLDYAAKNEQGEI